MNTAKKRAMELRGQGYDLDAIRKQILKEKLRTTHGNYPSRATVHRWIKDTVKPHAKDLTRHLAFYESVRGIMALPLPPAKKMEAIRTIL